VLVEKSYGDYLLKEEINNTLISGATCRKVLTRDSVKDMLYFQHEEASRALFYLAKTSLTDDEKNFEYYFDNIQNALASCGIILKENVKQRKSVKNYKLSVDAKSQQIARDNFGEDYVDIQLWN
jgi:hypothetical protein